MAAKASKLALGQTVVVSYLPLSHIAAQLFDIYLPICLGGTTYFAQPDALKVSSKFLSFIQEKEKYVIQKNYLCPIIRVQSSFLRH